MDSNEATKAEPAVEGPIMIRVVDQAGDEMQFRVKKETKMEKIFDSYAQRKGIPAASIRFLVDGKSLAREMTPKMLELEDGDQIDAVLYQEGGGEDDGGGGEEATMNIRVKDQAGEEMVFKVKKLTKMQKVFDAYSLRKGVSSNALRFMLDGQRIEGDSTPKMLELEDNDQIDVLLQQLGGRI